MFPRRRFQLPAFEDPEESAQLSLLKDAAARHGIRAKLRGDEIFQEGLNQAPRFLLNMEHYPKVGRGLCQCQHHGIMGRRYPEGGLLRHRK